MSHRNGYPDVCLEFKSSTDNRSHIDNRSHNSRRKSMRLAADPCLGFYVTADSPIVPPSQAPDVPPIEVLGSDGSCSSDEGPIVSVDAFLRRTATKTYSKKSRRKNRGKQRDLTNPHLILSDVMPADAKPSLTGHRPANPVHLQSKPLKKRLLRAAVLSHADPEECLLHDDAVFRSRKPLPFVEGRQSSDESIQTKRRTWGLVDPRKELPPRSNSFSSRSRAFPRSKKRDTLSGWRATYGRIYLDGSMINKRKTKASKIKCLPLSFVPLHEAEKSYSLMRLPHRVAVAKPMRYVPSDRIPLDLTSLHQHPSSPPQTSCITPGNSQTEPPCAPLVLTPPLAAPFPTPDARPRTSTVLNLFTDDPIPAITLLSNSPPVSALGNRDAFISPPPRVSPQIAQSTLKPLASYFDQFLQTARPETQLEKSKRKKTPRKMTRHLNQVDAPHLIGTLKSFIRNTVRQTSSARRREHASDSDFLSSSPNTFATHVPTFDVPPSMTTQFRVPSFPDAHRVFQPTPYQVVLPSTPPTSSRPKLHRNDSNDRDLTLDAAPQSP
ncbi:hypothetical protein B0H19DRAFT_1188881 [Mycena capillaripes]|nr:hypothetical protein B0H19DRAFT_1188881 [Mycena capillaripes]